MELRDFQIARTWTLSDRKIHIICLELKVVILALRHWVTVLQGHQVIIATDNTTVVSYINKQGGTHSPSLLLLVVHLSLYLQSQDIVLRARHIPGCLNMIADHLSDIEISNSGHVCHSPQCPFSPVYVSDFRASSTGTRCSVTRLAGKVDVHVSTCFPCPTKSFRNYVPPRTAR